MINSGIINETETNIGDEFKTFQIKATPEMFDMLSRKIYTNEKLAIIRELTTNGIDSMIEAGTINDKKLLVHLPDWNDPELRIRDYGTGLDDQGMIRVYTYGDTSRNTSNNYVGSFGIGSKSPFAYGDSGFEIISYFNGKQLTYNACKINGIPQIIKLSEDETSEPNGVEVKLTVEERDFSRFREEAKRFYAWFDHDVDINITDWDKEFYTKSDSILLDKPTYTLYPRDSYLFNGLKVKIYMGGILYELPSVFQKVVTQNLLSNVSVILKVPVGTFSLPPSREQISGTDENRRKLVELLSYVRTDMLDSFFEEDKKFIDSKDFSKNEIISYFMSDKWKRADLIYLNTDSWRYNDEYASIRESYLKILDKEYPWLIELLKNYNVSDKEKGFQKYMPIPDTTDLYAQWCLPKIPNSRVQNVTDYKKARNYGDVMFIRNTMSVQWDKFLMLHAKSAKFFGCEIYKRTDQPDSTNPTIVRHTYELQNIRKMDINILYSVRKMAMEYFGMREDQIIISSEFNTKYPLPKSKEIKVNSIHKRDKVENISLLAKKIYNSSFNGDAYFKTYNSNILSNQLVYVYEGTASDAKYVLNGSMFSAIRFIFHEMYKEGKLTEEITNPFVFMVQKRFEKKLPKDVIHLKDFILDYVTNHEFMILTENGEMEKDTYYYGEYHSSEFTYVKYLKFLDDKVLNKHENYIKEDRYPLVKLISIMLDHKNELDQLRDFLRYQALPAIDRALGIFGIDKKLIKTKKFVIPDLETWMSEHPIAKQYFERDLYNDYLHSCVIQLLAYEKLDESKVLLPFNNSLVGLP